MAENLVVYIMLIYAFGLYSFILIFLYKNRFTYLAEGVSWPPIRLIVGFYWGHIKGFIWPIFLILYLINLSKNKQSE